MKREFPIDTALAPSSRRDILQGLGAVALLAGMSGCEAAAQSTQPFTPEMFGARGDGRTDDYAALRRLAAAVNAAGGGAIRFQAGRNYFIDQIQITGGPEQNDVSHIAFNGCRGLTIDLNGAILSVKGDFHRAGNARGGRSSYSRGVIPLTLNRCMDVVIENGELYGNVDKMTRDEEVGESAGHGIAINACTRVLLRDLHVHHFSNDGVRLGTSRDQVPCEDVRLEHVRLFNNARQGLTNAGGINVVAIDSEFSGSGDTGGPYRHAPQSGVDIEPFGRPERDSDFRALRCRFDNNRGYPVVAAKPDDVSRVELIDCHSSNRSPKRMIMGAREWIIRGGTWHNVQIACMYAVRHRAQSSVSIDISGGTWTGDRPGWAPIYDLSPKQPTVRIHGNRFELRSPTPYSTTYLFQCSNPNHHFENNRIFIARGGHGGTGDKLVGNFQRAASVRNNHWTTDASAPMRFVNNYTGAARVEGERFSSAIVGRGMG